MNFDLDWLPSIKDYPDLEAVDVVIFHRNYSKLIEILWWCSRLLPQPGGCSWCQLKTKSSDNNRIIFGLFSVIFDRESGLFLLFKVIQSIDSLLLKCLLLKPHFLFSVSLCVTWYLKLASACRTWRFLLEVCARGLNVLLFLAHSSRITQTLLLGS